MKIDPNPFLSVREIKYSSQQGAEAHHIKDTQKDQLQFWFAVSEELSKAVQLL